MTIDELKQALWDRGVVLNMKAVPDPYSGVPESTLEVYIDGRMAHDDVGFGSLFDNEKRGLLLSLARQKTMRLEPKGDVLEWMLETLEEHMSPDAVFSEQTLEEWASGHGWEESDA